MSYAYYAVVLLLFAALALVGIRKRPVTGQTDLLGRYNNLRIFFAIEIIIGHCVKHFQTPLFLFENFLCISVAFFFFVSAYGLSLSYERKSDYLKGFLRGKCVYLLAISMIAYVISAVIAVISGTQTEFYTGPADVVKNYFISTNWYIWEQLGFYLLFFLVYKISAKRRWLWITLVTIMAVVIMYLLHCFEPYYTAALAFPFGCLVGENHQKMEQWLEKKHLLCGVIACAILILGMCCFITPAGNVARDVFLRNIMGIGVIMVLGYVLYSFACDNVVLRFLKPYTTEIYIFQFIWLQVTAGWGFGFMLKLPVVLIATIITAVVFHKLFVWVKQLCTVKHA